MTGKEKDEIRMLTTALQAIHRRLSHNPEVMYWDDLQKCMSICEKHLNRHDIKPRGECYSRDRLERIKAKIERDAKSEAENQKI